MIVQKDFLNKLKDFGLNTYEAKLWTALLSRGVSTAGELSDIANVPRSRTYDVLESLEKKEFIIMKLGKPIKYLAVPPEEVLERVKKKVHSDAEKQIGVLDSVKDSEVIKELNLLHNQGIELVEPTELSGSVRGRNNLYNHMETAIKSAEESITIMTTAEGLIRKAEALKNALNKAAKKGVKIRIAAPITKEAQQAIKDLAKIAEIRNVDPKEVKARFIIVDGKDLTFMLLDDKDVHPTYDVGIWVNTQLFSGALKNLFDSKWSKLKSTEIAKTPLN
jgi:sugar-specific transcriptional regulator TrmB